jgi:hypothetical protein
MGIAPIHGKTSFSNYAVSLPCVLANFTVPVLVTTSITSGFNLFNESISKFHSYPFGGI